MSRSEATERSQRWLQEQLDVLGGLRNATARDPSFKLWRQNTVTVLQRIWPGEPLRSEKFRRIPFSVSGSRPDPGSARGMYDRGCVEASAYLKSLIGEIEVHGVADAEPIERDALPGSHGEEDFPTVELPGRGASVPHGPDTGDNDIVLDLGGTASTKPIAPEASHEESLARPTLKIELPDSIRTPAAAAMPATPATPATPVTSTSHNATPSSAPARAARGGKSGRRGGKQRLKDMLGLSHLTAPIESESHEVNEVPAAPEPAAAIEPTPQPEPASAESGVFTTKPSRRGRGKHQVTIESLISPEFREVPAPPAAPEPAPTDAAAAAAAAADDEPAIDSEAFARATEDFLKNSPVLGLMGKPVVRAKDEQQWLDPDAVAVSTLSDDAARLGVPEGRRAATRAQLLELATRLEAGDPDWALLRESMNVAMEFPELARRLVPVLLPWLERAA